MSMELYIFSDRQLNSIAEWNSALASESFDLKIEEGPIRSLSGHQPAKLRNREVWVEFDHWNASKFLKEESDIHADRAWAYLLALRWNFDALAGCAAYMAAAAYAKATDGVVFDDQEAMFISWYRAAEIARQLDVA